MPDLTINDPTDCYACGYDLRGLRESGKCPECGLHVRFTLESRYSERLLERDNAERDEETKRFDLQTADADRQTAEADKINTKMFEQAEHFDRILARWDQVLEKFERVIDRMDKAT